MTFLSCLIAAAFFMAALSCAVLPFIAVWDRRLAVLRRRSLYDKSAGQTESLCAALHVLLAVALAADLLIKGNLDAMMVGPWRFPWEVLVLSAAFSALCAVTVLLTKRGLRTAAGVLCGLAGTLSACIVCVLVWSFFLGAFQQSAAGGEQATQAFMLALISVRSLGFLLFALFSVCVAVSGAYGLALCWHILRRGCDDFGRDYYTFVLGMRSRQASYAGLLVTLASVGVLLMGSAATDEQAQAFLPFAADYAEMLLAGGILGLPLAMLLWHDISRAAVPMQRRSLAFIALVLFAVGVYCVLGRV